MFDLIRKRVGRGGLGGLALLSLGAALWAQSGAPAQSSSSSQTPQASPQDNPFPGEDPKVPKTGTAPVQAPKQPAQKPGGDNPFPGEDPNAPIIPVDPGPVGPNGSEAGAGSSSASSSGSGDAGKGSSNAADSNGDPVRSPDGGANVTGDDGFSSSRSGVGNSPDENLEDAKPGKSVKVKTRAQVIKEDLDVGGFYLEKKNWKAAADRFDSAFKLDAENEDALWGLAEAERHLGINDKAREHYELFLAYDPDGPHSKAAKKALDLVESAGAAKPVGSAEPK